MYMYVYAFILLVKSFSYSQAKILAESTSQLCEAAIDVVQGEGDAQEGRLIGASKGVAATTAQFLHAAQVMADPHSQNYKRLQVKNMGGGKEEWGRKIRNE